MDKAVKKRLIIYGAIAVAFIALLSVATVFDLEISKKIADLKPGQYQSMNLFGRIFETVGELPVYFITIFASSIVFSYCLRKGKRTKFIIIAIFFEIISFFMGYFVFLRVFKYLNNHYDFAAFLDDSTKIAYAVLSGIMLYFVNMISKKYNDEFVVSLLPWAALTFAVVALSQFLTQICIKIPASRYRFCTMNALGDFGYYTKWFDFNGKMSATPEMVIAGIADDGLRSFPSGHTCAAATLITLTALPLFYEKSNNIKYKLISSFIIFAYLLTVMFTRILMGKHFLSDVLIGALVTVVCHIVIFFFGPKLFMRFKLFNF